MPTRCAQLLSVTERFPAGADDGSAVDAGFLDRVLPIWTGADGMPSLGLGGAVVSAKTVEAFAGRWQLHLFSFVAAARQARQTIRHLMPDAPCSVAARSNGEALLLVKEADGPFDCRIVDRRQTKGRDAPVGSWTLQPQLARRAALHIPSRNEGRVEDAARILDVEFDVPEDRDALQEKLGLARTGRCVGRILPQDVVNAANRLMEPLGAELSCSDRQILAAVDAHLATMRPDINGMVDRIAHEIVAEFAGSGRVG